MRSKILIFAMWFFLFAIVFTYPIFYWSTKDVIEITVRDKERITESFGSNLSSKYLIFSDEEVFENADSKLYLKFNSSDVYSKLKEGETYTVQVAGKRIKIFSMYRNIIAIK